jgi:predicted nucleic acid-binding protein
MQNVIIDTDVAIDFLSGDLYAKELIIPLWENNTAYLSVLSVYELQAGTKESEREDTNNFINACNIEPVTTDIAVKAGEVYRHHRKSGTALNSIDCLIAATAMTKKCRIATRNVKHYPDERLLYKKALTM